jgi:hypothetical protein
MHELGAELSSWIERKSGETEPLVNLTGWNFEAQRYYGIGTVLNKGDKVHTRCGFRNETGRPQEFGPRTEDEMCYNFLFVSPVEP